MNRVRRNLSVFFCSDSLVLVEKKFSSETLREAKIFIDNEFITPKEFLDGFQAKVA